MAWTAPKTWAVGDLATAADQNTYLRDNTKALRTNIDFVAISSTVTITATTEGTAAALITGSTLTYDTNAVIVDVYFPAISGNGTIAVTCFRGATNIGHCNAFAPAGGTNGYAGNFRFYDPTPVGGSYAYSTKAWITATATSISMSCGSGGVGAFPNAFQRVFAAVTT